MFGNNRTKAAQEILKNSKMLDMYSKFIEKVASAAFITLVATAAGGKLPDNIEQNANDGDVLSKFIKSFSSVSQNNEKNNCAGKNDQTEDTSKTSLNNEEDEETKSSKEEPLIQENIIEENAEDDVEYISDETNEENEESSYSYRVEFPKKRGRLSANQERLKAAVSELYLSDVEADRLTAICEKLLEKETDVPQDRSFSKNDAALMLADELTESINKAAIIDKYYKLFVSPDTEMDSPSAENSSKASIGKIKNALIEEDFVQGGKAKKNTSARSDAKSEIVNNIPYRKWKYNYLAPGTIDEDIYHAIKKMLLNVENDFLKQHKQFGYISWANRVNNATDITKEDVLKELDMQKEKTPYRNINSKKAKLVADLINSNKKFGQFSTLHAAMRLIDRFVNFNDELNIKKQYDNLLESFSNVVKRAFKQGVNIRPEPEKNTRYNRVVYKFRVEIPVSVYNDEEKKIFGSYPMVFVVCEYREFGTSYSKNPQTKRPLILTLFPEGMLW